MSDKPITVESVEIKFDSVAVECGSCHWFKPFKGEKSESGYCRRFPPTVTFNYYGREELIEYDWTSERPAVDKTDLCGEWVNEGEWNPSCSSFV